MAADAIALAASGLAPAFTEAFTYLPSLPLRGPALSPQNSRRVRENGGSGLREDRSAQLLRALTCCSAWCGIGCLVGLGWGSADPGRSVEEGPPPTSEELIRRRDGCGYDAKHRDGDHPAPGASMTPPAQLICEQALADGPRGFSHCPGAA